MNIYTCIPLLIYVLLLLGIGWYTHRFSAQSLNKYMLGGRGLGAVMIALSIGASDMSGWLLMGLPGSLYNQGISALWIAVGLTSGAFFSYLFVAPRLRVYTEICNNAITLPDYFSQRFADKNNLLKIFSGLVIVVFFALYTAAGMVSGGVLFQDIFHISYAGGVWLNAGIVVVYTFFGGFMAVSRADLVQGAIMFVALIMVPLVTIFDVGPALSVHIIQSLDPKYLDIFKGTSLVSVIGLLTWGFGYFGQPHILVRFMAVKHIRHLKSARRIGISWMLITVLGASCTGLFGISYLHYHGLYIANPEIIFIYLSQILFHPLIGGFLISAVLAAIMSTIAAQLLVTSSALTKDLYQLLREKYYSRPLSERHLVHIGKGSVLLIAGIATALALMKNDSILNLVGNAWAGFGASFGPMIVLSLFWRNFNKTGAAAAMISGALTVIIWISAHRFNTGLYEMAPGVLVSTLFGILCNRRGHANQEMKQSFDQMKAFIDRHTN